MKVKEAYNQNESLGFYFGTTVVTEVLSVTLSVIINLLVKYVEKHQD